MDVPLASGRNFTVLGLLSATAWIAISIVLLKSAGILGAVIIFSMTGIVHIVLRMLAADWSNEFTRPLWGIVMPAICWLFDPGILHPAFVQITLDPILVANSAFDFSVGSDWRLIWLTPFMAMQCLTLCIWQWLRPSGFELRCFVAGFCLSGAVFAFTVGILLLPFALMGLLYVGIGVLGVTPLLTGYQYLSVYREITENLRRQEMARHMHSLGANDEQIVIGIGGSYADAPPKKSEECIKTCEHVLMNSGSQLTVRVWIVIGFISSILASSVLSAIWELLV